MTRPVDKTKSVNYLKKADGALRMARIAVTEGEFDAAVMNSIHGAINAMDALTTFIWKKGRLGRTRKPCRWQRKS